MFSCNITIVAKSMETLKSEKIDAAYLQDQDFSRTWKTVVWVSK